VGGGWIEQFADAPDVLKSAAEQRRVVLAGGVAVGGDEFVTMAGPCSVETERQLRHVRDMDCDDAQGFFFARPLTAERMSRLLADQRHHATLSA